MIPKFGPDILATKIVIRVYHEAALSPEAVFEQVRMKIQGELSNGWVGDAVSLEESGPA